MTDSVRAFLILVLRARIDPAMAPVVAARVEDDLPWDAVVREAVEARVAPLVYDVLRGVPGVDPAALSTLGDHHRRTCAKNLSLLHALGGILARLRAVEVPVIVLKGAALAETVYGNVGLRPMGDADLLVREADLRPALTELGALGYTPADTAQRHDKMPADHSVIVRNRARPPFEIEMHWTLLNSPYHRARLDQRWPWERTVATTIGGAPALMLDPSAMLVHLCAHLLLHHGDDNLLWQHDVAELIRATANRLDWQEALREAARCELLLPLRQVVLRAVDQSGVRVPGSIVEALRAATPTTMERSVVRRRTSGSVVRRLATDLGELQGWGERLRFVWRDLVPPPAYMRERYAIHRPALVPFYYPYRWWLALRGGLARTRMPPGQTPDGDRTA